ncbi:hypothetical protein ACFCX4_28845 [Kitasatospora sp. NPDC056327]|uniref:hypothetical protein n=1 Tax=Kitasatospora sp. NPDC056327 TaxID=3345785 RepID=UPI0035DEAB15
MRVRRRDTGEPSGRHPGSDRPALRAIAGLLAVTGLATVGIAFAWFLSEHEELGAYRTAPACGRASPAGSACVRHEIGRVTERRSERAANGRDFLLKVSREAAPARDHEVDRALYDAVAVDTGVELTLWRDRVAEVAHDGHRSVTLRPSRWAVAAIAVMVGLGSALALQGLVRPHLGFRSIPFFGGWMIAATAFPVSAFFVVAQLSFALTLVLSVSGWLLTMAAAAAVVRDDYPPGTRR